MKTIIVPTDFSDFSEYAANYACELSIQQNTDVLLLHTYTLRYTNSGSFLNYNDVLKEVSLDYLKKEQKRLLNKYPDLTISRIKLKLDFSELDESIESLEKTGFYSMIVMGSKGQSAIKELFIGSQAAKMVEEATLPLLIIPGDYSYQRSKHLLFPVALDEKITTEDQLNFELFLNNETTIHIYHNYADYQEMDNEKEQKLIDEFHANFTNSIDLKLQFNSITISAIEKYAKQINADFIVTRKKKKSFFNTLFAVSISKELSYHTTVPLLVLK